MYVFFRGCCRCLLGSCWRCWFGIIFFVMVFVVVVVGRFFWLWWFFRLFYRLLGWSRGGIGWLGRGRRLGCRLVRVGGWWLGCGGGGWGRSRFCLWWCRSLGWWGRWRWKGRIGIELGRGGWCGWWGRGWRWLVVMGGRRWVGRGGGLFSCLGGGCKRLGGWVGIGGCCWGV